MQASVLGPLSVDGIRGGSLVHGSCKERSVIRREDDVDGRASVTKDEERVLRGG